jgi:hypothetical protein
MAISAYRSVPPIEVRESVKAVELPSEEAWTM